MLPTLTEPHFMPGAALLMDFLRRKWSYFHNRSDFQDLLTRSLLFVQRIIDHKCQHRISNHVGFKTVPQRTQANKYNDVTHETKKIESSAQTVIDTSADIPSSEPEPFLAATTVYPEATIAPETRRQVPPRHLNSNDEDEAEDEAAGGDNAKDFVREGDLEAEGGAEDYEAEEVDEEEQSCLEREIHCLMQYLIEIRSTQFYLRMAGQHIDGDDMHGAVLAHKHERRLLSTKRFALPMRCDQAPTMSFDWDKSAWDAMALDLAYSTTHTKLQLSAEAPLGSNGIVMGGTILEEISPEAQLLDNEAIVR